MLLIQLRVNFLSVALNPGVKLKPERHKSLSTNILSATTSNSLITGNYAAKEM